MVYVEFMKKFHLADSDEVMAVRLISASSAEKTFHSYFLDMLFIEFMKNFHLADASEVIALDSFRPHEPKTLSPNF